MNETAEWGRNNKWRRMQNPLQADGESQKRRRVGYTEPQARPTELAVDSLTVFDCVEAARRPLGVGRRSARTRTLLVPALALVTLRVKRPRRSQKQSNSRRGRWESFGATYFTSNEAQRLFAALRGSSRRPSDGQMRCGSTRPAACGTQVHCQEEVHLFLSMASRCFISQIKGEIRHIDDKRLSCVLQPRNQNTPPPSDANVSRVAPVSPQHTGASLLVQHIVV